MIAGMVEVEFRTPEARERAAGLVPSYNRIVTRGRYGWAVPTDMLKGVLLALEADGFETRTHVEVL